MQDRLLEVRGLVLRFGAVTAVDGVDLDVHRGEICGLIGPNGAGKTSLFNCVSGFYRPQAGSVRYTRRTETGPPGWVDVLEQPAHRLAHLGIARTFQELALFGSMTVREHVELATYPGTRAGWLAGAFRSPASRRERHRSAARADDLLAMLDLVEVADGPVTTLPFGTRKRVEIARALAGEPELLLLDEPASGLTPSELAPFSALFRRLRAELNLTILLIEHQMPMVLDLCDRVVVLDRGRVLAQGRPESIAAAPVVQAAYLGTAA